MTIPKLIKWFYEQPSPESIALREFEESRRRLLEAHTQQEYALKMVEYHQNRIKRLSAYLKEIMDEKQ